MGSHINEHGAFQSDKYPTCPAGKVPLSIKDPTAQDLLWEYAQRRRAADAEFSDDLEHCLRSAGYRPLAVYRIRDEETHWVVASDEDEAVSLMVEALLDGVASADAYIKSKCPSITRLNATDVLPIRDDERMTARQWIAAEGRGLIGTTAL